MAKTCRTRHATPRAPGGRACTGNILALVAFHDAVSNTAGLGAIHLAAPPVRVLVDDKQASSLDEAGWEDMAISCFEQQGQSIPVLDLSRLFSAAH
ncbi:hypothetical protein UNDYM_5360 [Undibacterium sp. YM2]|uniref:hypothetical protein n=1 Tax=Undibacterium sp. YM2 TaxID=2058625 RepID=UPI001331CBCD|nr:hypothetical protein [Undibacterium sp. YM2]BBB69613.1 hypothetical protein UNDYM_5360 [Undibacterium sp. YM2]